MVEGTKTLLVTGGASGIGAACARTFAAAGYCVMIADIQDDKGLHLASELGGDARYVHLDVAIEADFRNAIDGVMSHWGRLDCLINNAAIVGVMGPIAAISQVEWDHAYAVIQRSVFFGTKHAARAMQPRKTGNIVNIASAAAFAAGFSPHAYGTAKAAVKHFTHSTALELIEDGIRVNCICPGNVATPIHTGVTDDRWLTRIQKIQVAQQDDQPLPRFGQPEEIAEAALWLASEASAYVVGHALVIDGGLLAGRAWRKQPPHQRQYHPALR
ncbi:MAG: SDR family oxidoreductase [Gammaproteobacteria bacterium]|nr:SDR family oxidoreductase [Gammaproteobacteria bacterium]